MRLGVLLAAEPFKTNPAPEAICIRDRPLLKEDCAGPNFNVFCKVASLEASISATSALSPATAAELPMVKLICGLDAGQLPVPPMAIVTVPEVDEPLTVQLGLL